MTLRVARHREALKSCCWQRLYIYIYVYIYINAYTYICIKSAGLPRIMIDAVAGQRFSGKAGIWKEDDIEVVVLQPGSSADPSGIWKEDALRS